MEKLTDRAENLLLVPAGWLEWSRLVLEQEHHLRTWQPAGGLRRPARLTSFHPCLLQAAASAAVRVCGSECVCERETVSVCSSVSQQLPSPQIGTGFKDEDLEQHHSFLKVKYLSVTAALHHQRRLLIK